MNCDQTEKISLLIDGELATEETRAIERHLATCADCSQARADFLGLRGQIAAYNPQLESLAVRRALDRVLSKHHAVKQGPAPIARSTRKPFFGAFTPWDIMHRLNPALAAAAVLVLVGAAAFMVYRSRQVSVSENSQASAQIPTTGSPRGTHADSSPESVDLSTGAELPEEESRDLVAGNSGRKPVKGRPPEAPGPRKPNSRVKPTRERIKPSPLPQLQKYHPAPTYAVVNDGAPATSIVSVRSADAETMTASHLEQAELLLRAFRNVRFSGKGAGAEVGHERKRAQQLVYQNILLRREADNTGDVQVSTLLGSLEPVLLDIANLRDKPSREELRAIRERVERKSLVALLQVNSTAIARANE